MENKKKPCGWCGRIFNPRKDLYCRGCGRRIFYPRRFHHRRPRGLSPEEAWCGVCRCVIEPDGNGKSEFCPKCGSHSHISIIVM